MKVKVTNGAEYDAGLRRRGSLTLWVTDEVIVGWQAAPRSSRGGQALYSDLVIEAGLMLRLAFHLPLRQTEGLMASLFELLGVALRVPDHSTLSRRAMSLASVSKGCRLPAGPVHLLIDSTGLKVYGAGEWLQEKNGARARRTWRKLRLAVDALTGMIMASTLTENDVGDPSQVAPLLDQVDAEIVSVTADGAYDGAPTYDTVATHGEDIAVVIAPPVTAVLSDAAALNPSHRDRHIAMIPKPKGVWAGRRRPATAGAHSWRQRWVAIRPSLVRACAPAACRANAPKPPSAWPCPAAGCTPHRPTPSATRLALLEIDGQRDPSPKPRSMQQRHIARAERASGSRRAFDVKVLRRRMPPV